MECNVDASSMELEMGFAGIINMPDGSNVRKSIVQTLMRLQNKILESSEGDTKSLFLLITVSYDFICD